MQKWDQTLCEKDSDGDGKSNGQELGDPECQWSAEDGECELYDIATRYVYIDRSYIGYLLLTTSRQFNLAT